MLLFRKGAQTAPLQTLFGEKCNWTRGSWVGNPAYYLGDLARVGSELSQLVHSGFFIWLEPEV